MNVGPSINTQQEEGTITLTTANSLYPMPRARPPTPPRPDGEGSSADAHQSMNDDEHAQRRRQLLEDLKVLSSMGLNKELQLPQLVCIGSQSAGKSSLIETLCRITLPRSSGTCTRCPIECRSKYTDQPWMGRVFLRLEPEGTGSADAAEIPFGDVMTDPNLMEKRIAQAQLAVLSPNTEPSSFLAVDPTKYKAAPGFTNSSVIVDISGDGQADLNFVDLPGLIVNVADGGEAGHIELVKDMIRGYIRKENSIILLVVSCHTDYETQGAGILAAEFDPKGERTVGVLTKPDRIESSEEAGPWISMITGRSNRLTNGWYCVKQPDSKQRKKNLTWDEARDLEREFYQTNEAWARIPPEHRGRLGSKNLAYQLGNVLSVALEKRFAEIRIDVDRLIREATAALRQFPEAPKIPPSEFIQDLLSKFFKDVRKHIVEGDASAGNDGVIQQLRLQGVDFREQLQEVAPVFFPKSGIDIRDIDKPEFLHPSEQWIPASGGMQHSAEDVARQCQGGILRETIDFGSFDPTRYFMEQVAKEWELHATVLLEAAYEVVHTKLSTLVMNHFSLYSHGGLLSQISDLADDLLTQCKDRTELQLQFLAKQEAYPRTFHNALFDERRRLYEGYYVNYGVEGATLITMARTRTLYEFAFRRFADMGPLTIDLHFVNKFGDLIGGHVIAGINLLRDEDELRELLKMSDPMLAQRDALLERVRRLRTARTKLSS